MKKSILFSFLALFFTVSTLQAQVVINPVGVTMSGSNPLSTPPSNIIDGSGLSQFPSITATHENNSQTNGVIYFNESKTFDFDLGGTFDIEGLAFWNASGPNSNNFGIKDVVISYSQNGSTYTPISDAPTEFAESLPPPAVAEIFSFAAVSASHIRIAALNNHGEPTFTAINEIAFIGASPVTANVINPVAATTTLTAQLGSSLDNAINGSGLDEFPTLSGTHEGTSPANSFLASNEAGSIDFDLGGSYLVDGLSIWNQNAPGPGASGIQGVLVSSSQDGVTYTPIAGAPGAFAQVMGPTSPAEQFSFDEVTASFIRFDVLSNYGDMGNLVAFAEVAFSGVEDPFEVIECEYLRITNGTYTETEDLVAAIQGEFGTNYTITDWNDLAALSDLDTWISCMGLVDEQEFMVTKDGEYFFDANRQYFVGYFTGGSAPSNWMVHASIDDKLFLGSWFDMNKTILAKAGTTSLTEEENSRISMYPNPASDFVTLNNDSNTELEGLSIYDMNGRLLRQVAITRSFNNRINISDLPTGLYMFHIYGGPISTMKKVNKE